jgi:hypothetical protein
VGVAVADGAIVGDADADGAALGLAVGFPAQATTSSAPRNAETVKRRFTADLLW